ncbi:retrovirus-related Pol polyprotein from transposon opus [Trichonephila clavipes]|nr:retrovirus-related Pol polyprotein from transposon opus [Trichonephila clavipes]
MAQGIIRPSKSPWASPLHVVKKSNGEYRPCGDYRRLNSVTVLDRYPVPHIQVCTQNLHGKTIFTTLDLARAYHQIAINPPYIPKTALTTSFGKTSVKFLGCLITAEGVKPLPDKVEVIAKFPKPDTISQLRHHLEGHNFIIFTDHRPLTFAFNKISDSCSPRQLRHLDFIPQFSTDIRHVSGSDNSAADALSRINALNLSTSDLHHLADSQIKDEELKTLISSNDLSIKLKPLKVGNALEIFCDVSREKERPYVPEELHFEVFRSLHNLSHPGIHATKRLIKTTSSGRPC